MSELWAGRVCVCECSRRETFPLKVICNATVRRISHLYIYLRERCMCFPLSNRISQKWRMISFCAFRMICFILYHSNSNFYPLNAINWYMHRKSTSTLARTKIRFVATQRALEHEYEWCGRVWVKMYSVCLLRMGSARHAYVGWMKKIQPDWCKLM